MTTSWQAIGSFLVAACLATEGVAQEVRSLNAHKDAVYSVAYSPDGATLVSGSFDTTSIIWNLETNKPVRTIADRTQGVSAVAVSPDGRMLATAGLDRQIKLYDMPMVAPLARIPEQPDGISVLDVSPDGKLLVTSDWKGRTKLWNADTLDHIRDLTGERKRASDLEFSPDGTQILLGDETDWLTAYQIADGKEVGHVYSHEYETLAMAPDGKTVATGDSLGHVRLYNWPFRLGTESSEATGSIRSMTASRDGSRIVVGSDDGKARLYDAAGKLLQTLEHGSAIRGVAITTDNKTVSVSAQDGRVTLWSADDGKAIAAWKAHGDQAYGMAFRPDGKQLATCGNDRVVRLWKFPVATSSREKVGEEALNAGVLSHDGRMLAVIRNNKKMEFITSADGKTAGQLDGGDDVKTVSLRADGSQAIFGRGDGTVRIVNTNNASNVAEHKFEKAIIAVAIKPQGDLFAYCDADKKIRIARVNNAEIVHTIEGADRDPLSLTFSPDGSKLVSLQNNTARVYRVDNAQQERSFDKSGDLRTVAFSRDGSQIALGSMYQGTWVHRMNDGGQVAHFDKSGSSRSLAFTADGKRLYTLGEDKKGRVFRIQEPLELQFFSVESEPRVMALQGDGNAVLVLETDGHRSTIPTPIEKLLPHNGDVLAVNYIPGGTHLVSAGSENKVRLWDIANEKVTREFNGAGTMRDVCVSPDTKYVICVGQSRLQVWMYGDGSEVVNHDFQTGLESVSVAPDSRRVIVAGSGQYSWLFDIDSKLELERFMAGSGATHAVAFVNDNVIAAGGDDKTLRIEPVQGRTGTKIPDGKIYDLVFSPESARLYVSNGQNKVRGLQVSNLAQVVEFGGAGEPVWHLSLSGNGRVLAGGGQDDRLRLWDTTNAQPIAQHDLKADIYAVAMDRDGQTVLVANAYRDLHTLARARENNQEVLQDVAVTKAHAGEIRTLAFRGEEQRAWTGGGDKVAATWFIARGPALRNLSGHSETIYDLEFSPDGTQLASASADRTIRLWDPESGQTRQTITGHEAGVYAVSWRPGVADGNAVALASASADGTVRFWNAAGQQAAKPTDALTDGLYSVSFFPDGSHVAAGGLDRQWHRWALGQPQPERSVDAHAHYIYSVAVSPSGQRLATLGYGGELKIWNLSDGKEVYKADLPLQAGYQLAYHPKGEEIAVAGLSKTFSVLRVMLPGHAR
jgi:WD40 repeat protein